MTEKAQHHKRPSSLQDSLLPLLPISPNIERSESSTMSEPTLYGQYNILVVGETQAGKSKLIQSFMKYADIDYKIDTSAIGNGSNSLTTAIRHYSLTTDLPAYYVDKNIPNPGKKCAVERVDYGEFVNEDDVDDYEDKLNETDDLHLRRGDLTEQYKFNIIDTPGLNDTTNQDEGHVLKIFEALVKIKNVSLVLIAIRRGPFTPGVKEAIQSYVDLFPDFNGIIAFVHTHVDYKELHPTNDKFTTYIRQKKSQLHGIVRRNEEDSVPHFLIDCDLASEKPIRNCITLNVLRTILKMATFTQPVSVMSMTLRKTKNMKDIDMSLKDKYGAALVVMEETLRIKNEEEGDILARINTYKSDIITRKAQYASAVEVLKQLDTDALDPIYEKFVQENWNWKRNILPPKHKLEFPAQTLKIDHIDIMKLNVHVYEEIGGKPEKYWGMTFRRNRHQNGVLHVRIYVKKNQRYRRRISETQTSLYRLQGEMDGLQRKLDRDAAAEVEQRKEIQQLLEEQDRLTYLKGCVSSVSLRSSLFNMFVKEGTYLGSIANNAKKVEEIYLRLRNLNAEGGDDGEKKVAIPIKERSTEIQDDGESLLTPENEAKSAEEDEPLDLAWSEETVAAQAKKAHEDTRKANQESLAGTLAGVHLELKEI